MTFCTPTNSIANSAATFAEMVFLRKASSMGFGVANPWADAERYDFVVRAGRSPFRLIQRALDAVGRNRIIGVVLNAIKESDDVVGYGYYGYYGTYGPQRKRTARPGR